MESAPEEISPKRQLAILPKPVERKGKREPLPEITGSEIADSVVSLIRSNAHRTYSFDLDHRNPLDIVRDFAEHELSGLFDPEEKRVATRDDMEPLMDLRAGVIKRFSSRSALGLFVAAWDEAVFTQVFPQMVQNSILFYYVSDGMAQDILAQFPVLKTSPKIDPQMEVPLATVVEVVLDFTHKDAPGVAFSVGCATEAIRELINCWKGTDGLVVLNAEMAHFERLYRREFFPSTPEWQGFKKSIYRQIYSGYVDSARAMMIDWEAQEGTLGLDVDEKFKLFASELLPRLRLRGGARGNCSNANSPHRKRVQESVERFYCHEYFFRPGAEARSGRARAKKKPPKGNR